MIDKIEFLKILVLTINSIFAFKIIPNIYLFVEYLENYIKFKYIEFDSKQCNDQKAINEFKNIDKPKISVISPVYNREKYIFRFIRSIQIQNFYELEMIFIDDNSSDKSVNLIKKYMKKDKRIKLIKNRKNRGTFKARNIGALYSKGKYIIIPDPDGILSSNILNVCYNYAEKYKYDIIRFNTYLGRGKLFLNNFAKNHEDRPIVQPELSTYVFYGNKEIKRIDFYVTNKFIKKKIYIKALNSLNIFYYNMYMTIMEDQIMNFLIHRVAKSFYYINKIGYRYYNSKKSIYNNKILISELHLKFIFYYLKFIFEYSKNTKYEKDMANLLFTHYNKRFNIRRQLSSLVYNRDDFSLFENVINLYLNCPFINDDNKLILQKLNNIIK